MQSVVKRAFCTSAAILALAAASPASAQESWYAIIPFEVAPENRARVAELSGATVAPAQAAIGREMLQFFPAGDDTSGFLILGRFDSAEDALAHANPGQDTEFLAAYQAHMGDAGGAATQETMRMMTPGPAMIGRRFVTSPPVADGARAGAAPVYYVAHSLDLTDEADADGGAIVGEDFGPVAEGGEVMMFELTGEAPLDWLIFTGRHADEAEAAAAAGFPILRDGAARAQDAAAVYRHPPE